MIDSVLKGTGNSRFLKSAVPAGTSWADALAMLQAGTFPIDFNGINTEGFQQVGTPLNKANLLKDATTAQIGLPPSTTPDGMFQALGNTGELHVWKKTVTTTEEQPAGFTLGDVQTNVSIGISVSSGASLSRAHNINVSDAGVATLDMSNTYAGTWTTDNSITTLNVSEYYIALSGKPTQSAIQVGDVYYVPSGGAIVKNGSTLYLTSAQKVNAHGIIPAGTTTTYPVSTNPNAYQEGDDAKAAGYVVGEPKTTVIPIHPGNTIDPFYYGDANNVAVTNDGVVSVSSETYVSLSPYNTNNTDSVKGKYIQGYPTGYPVTSVYYIPADATFSNANGELVCDKAQLVTGYAAIPAGTTIEYLGKLGDKTRVQFGSYIGTGTYGESNPNTLNLSFTPRFLLVMTGDRMNGIGSYANFALFVYGVANGITVGPSSANYEIPLYATWNKNSVSWYNTDSDYRSGGQLNGSGAKYRYVAIG